MQHLSPVLAYFAVTAYLGRDVLAHLSTVVTHDAGDPLLTAAILKWNATHIPLSDAWWQFPIFYPTRDALAFSEHLLGLSVIASPLYWITRDALVTANIVTLLTFPLCALAMYALVFRITGSIAGAFVGGLAFAFAPYRISQLPHVQMLASFWAPLALLGLHAYLETGRRRWLVLYGAAWTLQAAANGYALFFFSTAVGLWVLWFVVARRRWRDLVMIAGATVVAALPLAPILYKYVVVHAEHGLVRSIDEMRYYSADVIGVLCASADLTFWGWLRIMCRAEGELFPGVVIAALCVIAFIRTLGWFGKPGTSRLAKGVAIVGRTLVIVGLIYGAVVLSVFILGPWHVDLGFLSVSTSSIRKPLLVCITAFALALILSPGVRAAIARSSSIGFYLVAALVMWVFALGPTITVMSVRSGYDGPFMWLLELPGANGVRVPARFWLMVTICLAVVVGLLIADVLKGRSKAVAAAIVLIVSCGVLSDSWIGRIPVEPAPPTIEDATSLAGKVVLEIPMESLRDTAAQWRAVVGGWRVVNGYSGYNMSYYPALVQAVRIGDEVLFRPFQRDSELHVIVPDNAEGLKALVEKQPGATVTGRGVLGTLYRLPQRSWPVVGGEGERIPIASLQSSCGNEGLTMAFDGDVQTRWICPSGMLQEFIIDLGRPERVGAVVQSMGPFFDEVPRAMAVDTSNDLAAWEAGWNGNILGQALAGGMRDPKNLPIVTSFEPRDARYLRVRRVNGDEDLNWTVAEVEVRSR